MSDLSVSETPVCGVRPNLYRVTTACFLLFLLGIACAASVEERGWAALFWVLGSIWTIPAYLSWRVLRGPRRLIVTPEGLRLERGDASHLVPWGRVVGFQGRYTHSVTRARHAFHVVCSGGKIVTVPRSTDCENRRFYDALLGHAAEALAASHAPEPSGAGWKIYADVPSPLVEILRDLQEESVTGTACLFRGPVRKAQVSVRVLRAFLGALTAGCLLLGFLGGTGEAQAMGFVFTGVLGLFWFFTFLPSGRLGKEAAWILIHPKGLAMLGKRLTGELNWTEVQSVSLKKPSAGFVRTCDGAAIPILDIYDVPLAVIVELCNKRFAAVSAGFGTPGLPDAGRTSSE